LDNGALVNVQTTSGETPLHLAAESGVPGVVESLLRCADIRLDIRDEYGDTPFSKAAKAKSTHALHLLAPYRAERVPKKELDASKTFKAMIVDFGRFPNGKRRIEMTMHDLLYFQTPVRAPDLTARPRPLLLPKLSKSRLSPNMHQAIHFRWIHLPANNIAWAEALLTKAFVEEGDYDVDKFMAVERSIETLQRSQKFESHYMRPSCDPITGDEAGSSFTAKPKPPDPKSAPEISPGPPLVVVNYGTTDEDLPDERTRRKGKKESSQGAGRETVTEEPPRSRSRRRRRGATEPIESDSEQPSKMSKSAQLAARHPQKKKKPKPNSSPPAPPVEPLPPYAMDDSSVFLLMPYVHFEQGRDLPSMEKTIQSALMTNPEATRMMLNTSHLYKEESNHRRSHSPNDFDIRAMTFYRKLNSSKEAVVQVSRMPIHDD
jgi:ankyrin repeat protein